MYATTSAFLFFKLLSGGLGSVCTLQVFKVVVATVLTQRAVFTNFSIFLLMQLCHGKTCFWILSYTAWSLLKGFFFFWFFGCIYFFLFCIFLVRHAQWTVNLMIAISAKTCELSEMQFRVRASGCGLLYFFYTCFY